MKRIAYICLLLLLPLGMHAQTETDGEPPSHALLFGAYAHSYGFGIEVQSLQLRESGSALFFSLGIASLKNPKELNVESAYVDQGGKNYIYDKLNYAYTLTPSIGLSREWIPAGNFSKVSLRTTLSVGPNLAILKPYYIEVAIPVSQNQAIVEVHKYDPAEHNYGNIVGEADYFLGMDELKIRPGVRARFHTLLDFSPAAEYIRGVEVSAYADLFPKAPEIMGSMDNRRVFVGGTVGFFLGNTW